MLGLQHRGPRFPYRWIAKDKDGVITDAILIRTLSNFMLLDTVDRSIRCPPPRVEPLPYANKHNASTAEYVRAWQEGGGEMTVQLPLSAPKVPFLNSALPEECPVCVYWQSGSMAPHSAGWMRHVPAPNRPHTRYRDAQAHPWRAYVGGVDVRGR